MKGTLYLIPGLLGDIPVGRVLPPHIGEVTGMIRYFIVEDTRTARRYLKRIHPSISFSDIVFFELDKHGDESAMAHFIDPAGEGYDIGLLSEAGVPAVADPGSALVRIAHERGIRVVPLAGPSSILLALMASGMNGQNFAFNGYLPIHRKERIQAIRELEQRAGRENQTQIIIETPYRNQALLDDLVNTCNPSTLVCVATDITLGDEFISTRTAGKWKKDMPDIDKRPTVFLIWQIPARKRRPG